ncbi:MAG TPA: type IV secretion system DNA-binding domain-containing protein [Solirubrobacteraceae bacterium]
MPSETPTNPSSEWAPNPLEPIEQLAHWLAAAVVYGVLGVAIGLVAVRLMHHRHLRWTWAPTALGVDLLVGPVFGGSVAWTLGIAALCATVRGRRWHREEVAAGADLAELAANRRGPWDALRTFVRRTAPRLIAGWAPQSTILAGARDWLGRAVGKVSLIDTAAKGWFRGDRLIVGEQEHGRPVSIPLGGPTGGTHTLVVGAAGSGKTVTMTWMAVRAIEHDMGTIVLDPKGDRDLCRELRDAARATGRQFIEWTPRGPSVYNPYARGSETEIADKVLAGERFTEPHYLRQAQRYLGHAVRVLRKAGLEVSLQALVEQLDPTRLEVLARSLPEAEAQGVHEYLDKLTKRQQSDLAGVRDRLAIMAESDIGPWLDPETEGVQRLDLLDAAKTRAVVYFNLEADRRPLLAQMLGAAIVQDLQTMVAALQGRPMETLVMIDEFSAIVPERVVGLFARARGAGISLLLGTQELADLRVPGRELLHDQVMGNLSALIAHRQVVPASAELIASMTETRGVWRTSHHSNGGHTRTREHENVLRAEQIMGLPRGWAAVLGLADGGCVSITQMFSVARHR